MYSRDEASNLKQQFWTAFGQYISPVRSAEGGKVNWINYKTGLKHVYFKMDADKRHAAIGIELSHPDDGIRELFFEQFKEYKNILEQALDEKWTWELSVQNESGKIVSRIYTEKHELSIFNRQDWPELISFFKPRIIALDAFWTDVKDGFDSLK